MFSVTVAIRTASSGERGVRAILKKRTGLSSLVVDQTLERLPAIADRFEVLSEDDTKWAVTSQLGRALNAVPNIDPTDANLAALVIERHPEDGLLSGDKRFIRAMSATFPDEFSKLQGRLFCLEDCLIRLVEVHGFEALRPKLIAAAACDEAVRLALGGGANVLQADFVEAMVSFRN